MRIAIDAMGGDRGPSVIVDGALVAARHLQVGLLLVGAQNAIEVELSRRPALRGLDIQIADAPERIEMAEPAASALRRKPRASIRVAAQAVRDGEGEGLFSAGPTGAAGVGRPAAMPAPAGAGRAG